MANTLLFNLPTVRELNSGATGTYHWNNASPTDAVWTANAVPLVDDTSESQDIAFEVIRLWRRVIFTKDGSAPGAGTLESEIWYTIKNVGPKKAKFMIFLAATS